jgi:hypothetical protein
MEDFLFDKQIPADVARLRAAPDAAARTKMLASMLRVRIYHHGGPNAKPSRRKLDYPGLARTLEEELKAKIPALASGLSASTVAELSTHYTVEARGTDTKAAEHETMVGHGDLKDALSNAPIP